MNNKIIQQALCKKYHVNFNEVADDLKIGVSHNIKDNIWPLNGLRHLPSEGTSGWYIWAGETIGSKEDFFVPLHLQHLSAWNSVAIKYLGLPPGYRFLTDGVYEDVWFDEELLIS